MVLNFSVASYAALREMCRKCPNDARTHWEINLKGTVPTRFFTSTSLHETYQPMPPIATLV
jgi:hypothetical protein